jgi:hypothetical protein
MTETTDASVASGIESQSGWDEFLATPGTQEADLDGDGNVDTWIADASGDGQPDVVAFDVDADAEPEVVVVDVNEDETPDVALIDTDESGTPDLAVVDLEAAGLAGTTEESDAGDAAAVEVEEPENLDT